MLTQWFWGKYSTCYDTVTQLVPYRQMLDDLIDALDIQPGMRLLNAGCGTGNLECRLAQRGIDCTMTSLDFSGVMLERARKKCQGMPITFLQGDLNARLPFADASFDRIVSTNVLYTLKSPARTLEELSRVLVPGGIMAHATPAFGFRMAPILTAHLRQASTREKWRSLRLFPSFAMLYLYNLVLLRQEEKGDYLFLTPSQAEACIRQERLSGALHKTYADQDWLMVAERSCDAITV